MVIVSHMLIDIFVVNEIIITTLGIRYRMYESHFLLDNLRLAIPISSHLALRQRLLHAELRGEDGRRPLCMNYQPNYYRLHNLLGWSRYGKTKQSY